MLEKECTERASAIFNLSDDVTVDKRSHMNQKCSCRMISSIGSASCTLFFILLAPAFLLAEVNHNEREVEFHGEGEITSPGFPSTCCQPATYTIQPAVGAKPGYIRMTFNDLDLPTGSRLELYDGSSALKDLLFAVQPEVHRGVWSRPAIAASTKGGNIHVVFVPANYSGSEYVGFKASYWVTNAPPENWHDKPIPDVCTPLVSVLSGERVRQKTIQLSEYMGRTIDCVWQLKPPGWDEKDNLMARNIKVYARIGILSFTGYLDVKQGTSSMGKVLKEVSMPPLMDLSELGQSIKGYTSSEGLYIHLSMLNEGRGIFDFIYGILHQQPDMINAEMSECYFGGDGFLCHTVNESWCIPFSHKCNGVKNCVNGEDELCDVEVLVTQMPSTSTLPLSSTTTQAASLFNPGIAPPTKTCGDSDYMCKDGKCKTNCGNVGNVCRDSHFSGNSVWCPSEGCISYIKYGFNCRYFCGKCSDGSCQEDSTCPGACVYPRQKCSDGSCIDVFSNCPNGCSWYQKGCPDGRCISSSSSCSQKDCYSSQQLCSDGSACIYESDKCDGFADCNDNSDEQGCPGGFWNRSKYWIIIPFAVICVIAIIYKLSRNRRHTTFGQPAADETHTRTSNAVSSRTAYHSIVSRNINSQTPNYTGTRLMPVESSLSPSLERNQLLSDNSHYPTASAYPPANSVPDGGNMPGTEAGSTSPPQVSAATSLPPPGYDEVVADQDTYRPPVNDETAPPSYDTVRPAII